MISLENLDDFNGKAILNSPRSLEACSRLGINPKELLFKPFEDFKQKNLDHKIAELRFQHHDSKRKELIYNAKKERAEITQILESQVQYLKPGSFIQPIEVLQHQAMEYSKSMVKGPFSPLSKTSASQISSRHKTSMALNPNHSQPQISLEQSQLQAFQQLQKQGIIDDNYYKRFALNQKVENKVMLTNIDKNIDHELAAKELEQKALIEEINQLMKIEEEHQNFYYKTRQKVKREQDQYNQKQRELLQKKQEYKKQLQSQIDGLMKEKNSREQKEQKKLQKIRDTDNFIRDKLFKIRQLQDSSLNKKMNKVKQGEQKAENCELTKQKELDKMVAIKRQKRQEKEILRQQKLKELEKEKEIKQQEILEKLVKEDEDYERKVMMATTVQKADFGNDDKNLFDKKERFRVVKQEGEKLARQRQQDLIERMQKVEELQKKKQDEKHKQQMIKKEQQALKEKSKEENVQRHQRRLEYKKELYLQRLKAEQLTFNEARKLKHEVIQERYYNHMIDEIKRNQMKSNMEKMQLNKKFDKDSIKKITKEFEFMTQVSTDYKGSVLEDQTISPSKPFSTGTKSQTNIFSDKMRGHSSHMGSRSKLGQEQQQIPQFPIKIGGGKKLHQALKIIQKNPLFGDISTRQFASHGQKPYSAQFMNRNFSQPNLQPQYTNETNKYGGTGIYITSQQDPDMEGFQNEF